MSKYRNTKYSQNSFKRKKKKGISSSVIMTVLIIAALLACIGAVANISKKDRATSSDAVTTTPNDNYFVTTSECSRFMLVNGQLEVSAIDKRGINSSVSCTVEQTGPNGEFKIIVPSGYTHLSFTILDTYTSEYSDPLEIVLVDDDFNTFYDHELHIWTEPIDYME